MNIRIYALKKFPVFRNVVLYVASHNCRAALHEKTAKKQIFEGRMLTQSFYYKFRRCNSGYPGPW
jgi:hypothetical protein